MYEPYKSAISVALDCYLHCYSRKEYRYINTIISRRIMIIMMKMNEHQISAFRLNGRGEEEEEEAEKEE